MHLIFIHYFRLIFRRLVTPVLSGVVLLALSLPAAAIPSPELVIGSVSSLSQVFAVGFAFVSGAAALVARKFGINITGMGRVSPTLITVTALLILGLGVANVWQYRVAAQGELQRMQATLVRPAQFKGTTIKDETLKETSFSKQRQSDQAITTDELAALLERGTDRQPLLFDVRETGEHAMGSLPNSTHIRYPDFLNQNMDLKGKDVILFCHNGNRSSETCGRLAALGIDCRFVAGGIEKWIVEGRPFSDADVKQLSDLRALPVYENKEHLITTEAFSALMNGEDIQIVDTRYPKDFEAGHLPGAINIPVRALPTEELQARFASLKPIPTVAACYDRRSCFMSQVLGLELTQAGIPFLGRYTTPWDYFVPPAPKPHVAAWLAEQNTGIWQRMINAVAAFMLQASNSIGVLGAIAALAVLSRVLVLPIAIKSERDQIVTAKYADRLKQMKADLAQDPTRKARAIQQFYADKGLTPMRNLVALLFLPLMMLGLSATEHMGSMLGTPMWWAPSLGLPDPILALPVMFCLLAGIYLHWAVAKNRKQAVLWWVIGTPLLFLLVFRLSFAGNLYLTLAIGLLLAQRAYVTGIWRKAALHARGIWRKFRVHRMWDGIVPLGYVRALTTSGNKSYRLSVMRNAGLPVPNGAVLRSDVIARFQQMTAAQKDALAAKVWRLVGEKPCAVRSSARGEDGADQSFAGIYDSVLHVTEHTLRDAIETVVTSFGATRAQSYSSDGTTGDDGNVLVQQMVEADFAGVMFTQDPTAPGLMMIELAKGTGDDLVSGRVTPETHRFGRYTKRAVCDDPAPFDLTPLIALGDQIEALFGTPQDIEWAYKDGAFFILQSRDITTLAIGTKAQQFRVSEWRRMFSTLKDAPRDGVILEQDEMSEVLPNPTPASFSLMGNLWSPGGSLDLACRDLGVAYCVPEGQAGHLVNLFGKTFVDRQLKDAMALKVSPSKAKHLRRLAHSAPAQFREVTMPELHQFLAHWMATDLKKLPMESLQKALRTFQSKLIQDVYVEAEKVNILAGFTMAEAQAFVSEHPDHADRLRRAELTHTPTGIMRACLPLSGAKRKAMALERLGHRAMFDYELSLPRYVEAPDMLWSMMTALRSGTSQAEMAADSEDPITLALSLQDLKEQAKHEALRLVQLIRQTLLAMGAQTGLGNAVFHLKMEELATLSDATLPRLKAIAKRRKKQMKAYRDVQPKAVELTLFDCEILSAPDLQHESPADGAIVGTCVSGSKPRKGRVFVVDESHDTADPFAGFQDGDILVCHMVNPEWLPQIQRASAVLAEVGGWLSHMSIVAREHNLLMLVACKGISQLQTGEIVAVALDGQVEQVEVTLELAV